ncbi:MAG: peroxiredoxin family protein [Thermomicrobiales bacterium]
MAVAIVAAAWVVGGRQGFDQIGTGGINQNLLPKVGDVAPDFTVYDLNGRPVSLSEFHGQPVWLNFWGSWCAPCRSEMPEIQRAYEQLAPQGLVLLAISMRESPEEAAAFAARNHATFTILTDQYEQATGADYPIVNFPTHIFIDRQGIIHTIVLAEMDAETALDHGRELIAAG